MDWFPHVTVAAIIEDNGRFLMVEEESSTGERVINQPAGHLEAEETIIEAVVRETLEETAWHFTPRELVGIYQYLHPTTRDTYLRFNFCGEHTQHDADRPLDPDILATHWYTLAEIQARESQWRTPVVMQCLRDYLNGVRYPLSILN